MNLEMERRTGQAACDAASTNLGDHCLTFVLSHPSRHRLEAVCNLVTDAFFMGAGVVSVEVIVNVENCSSC